MTYFVREIILGPTVLAKTVGPKIIWDGRRRDPGNEAASSIFFFSKIQGERAQKNEGQLRAQGATPFE